MKEFHGRYAALLKRREQLERDPQAPSELWSQVVRTGVKAGLSASKAVPGVAPVVDLVGGDLVADAVDQARVFLTRKLRDSRDVRLLLSPTEELSPVFVSGLVKQAARGPVALFFDTFEQTSAFLDGWLLDLLAGRYGDLPTSLVLVVAGRLPLDSNRWSDYLSLVAPVPLAPFTEAETRQLLTAEGVTEERTVQVIMGLSGGLPLLVDMLAKNRPDDPSAVGDPTGTAVDRFLKWETDETRRRAALAGALPRRIDEDLLVAATDASDASELFGWLVGQPFISSRAGRYQYHEVVRAPMLRWQRQRSPQRWRADHLRLADQYRTRRDELGPQADWSDPAWLDHQLEETYHRLCANQVAIETAVRDAVFVAKVGPAAARRWAEMILEVGRVRDEEMISRCGVRLLGSVDDDAKDCLNFLTLLLELGYLDTTGEVRALVERARIHYFADRDEQAVQDSTLAIDRDSQCADAYAVRASGHTTLGRYEPALTDFNRAIELNPNYAWAIANRGENCRLMERYDDALTDFTRAIELDPSDAWFYGHRGRTYRDMGSPHEAEADFARARDLDPTEDWADPDTSRTIGDG